MSDHELAYDAIIEGLAHAGKILEGEDLVVTYLNTLPEEYWGLIEPIEPHLDMLTSQ